MTLSPAFLDELRARTLLSAVVGKQVKLTRAGREFKACCPFHNEKTPSFYINDDKGFYHCFGCQAHGDAIRFLTDSRGLPFMDAVKELAEAAGLDLPAPDPWAQAKAERANSLYDVMAAAQAWFEAQLAGIDGAEARAYLTKRGISEATRARFGFGFAPDSRGKLKTALKEFGTEKLVEAGLLIAVEDKEPYDRFRGRLTFPIKDRRGRVIAFSARILGTGEPKYLNSPDTPLFDKGRTLFNIDRAAAASREAKRVIVVEGQMDVIALDQAGIAEAVAPLGTALTDTQLELLWKLDAAPILCFDADAAGQKATIRAARKALPLVTPERTLQFAQLPPGQDPDDLLKSGGRAALLGFLASAQGLADRIWRAELEESSTDTPEARGGIKERLLAYADSIQNPSVRSQYRQLYSDRFWEAFGWRKRDVKQVADEIVASKKQARPGFTPLVQRAMLLGVSRYPDVLAESSEAMARIQFCDEHLSKWFNVLLSALFENPELEEDLIDQIVDSSEVAPIKKRDITRDLAFSFFRKNEPQRARSDLREVIGTLVAEQEVERALEGARERIRGKLEQPELQEVYRLQTAREELRGRLSELAEQMAQVSREAG